MLLNTSETNSYCLSLVSVESGKLLIVVINMKWNFNRKHVQLEVKISWFYFPLHLFWYRVFKVSFPCSV